MKLFEPIVTGLVEEVWDDRKPRHWLEFFYVLNVRVPRRVFSWFAK